MAKDPLTDAGLHFDELNKLRVLDPDVSQKTTELKEECKDFVDSKFIKVYSDNYSEFFINIYGLHWLQILLWGLTHSATY